MPPPPETASASPAPPSKPDQIGYSKNIKHLSNTPHVGPFAGQFGTDLAFQDDRAYVGNYQGFIIYDISEPSAPVTLAQVNCPGSQNDITVSGDLVYLSTDSSRSDDSCASTTQSVNEPGLVGGHQDLRRLRPDGAEVHQVGRDQVRLAHPHRWCPATTPTTSTSRATARRADVGRLQAAARPDLDRQGAARRPRRAPASSRRRSSSPRAATPTPPAATTSPPTRARTSRRARAWATASSWTSPTRRPPRSSRRCATPTSRSGTRRRSTATRPRSSSPTSSVAGPARPATRASGRTAAPTRSTTCRPDNELTFKSYYKIAASPERHRELRRAQRVDHPGRRPRRHGAVLVPGRCLPVGVHRLRQPEGARLLRARARWSRRRLGGTWSAYYYNGFVYSSDIQKGFDVLMLKDPTLRKANSVRLEPVQRAVPAGLPDPLTHDRHSARPDTRTTTARPLRGAGRPASSGSRRGVRGG